MSMLSSQVDELRELATRYDELQVGAVKAVTMPSNMGSILREAADTIWELRDDLQRANAENAKLREQIHWLKKGDILHVLTDQEYIDQCERERLMQVSIDALDKDNAKLRERLRSVVNKYCDSGTCDGCPILGKDDSCPY